MDREGGARADVNAERGQRLPASREQR